MQRYNRKSAPKVRGGAVQKKNRWDLTPNYYNTAPKQLIIDRQKPGDGHRHLLKKKDIYDFIEIIPEWEDLAKGLRAIVLATAQWGLMGWHDYGVIGLCAWERSISWDDCHPDFYEEHKEIFEKLNIPCRRNKDRYIVGFDVESAKAFQLIHILIHELGHHHDRMTTKSQEDAARGEHYAENYARRFEDEILTVYQRRFRF